MRSLLVAPASCLKGKIYLPGDKSIAHRSLIISAVSHGKTTIKNFPDNQDCLYTLKAFNKLGIEILRAGDTITVFGKGLYGLRKPKGPIFVGDSGTTLRLLSGILAGQNFASTLKADKSLSKRPMLRITEPLRLMGAHISARRTANGAQQEEYPPLTIRGGNLKPLVYKMPVASSQVKSAVFLAGLYAEGLTAVIERIRTRDHTERMLKLFKAEIKLKRNTVVIEGKKELVSPGRITIPGDISSGSFFIVLTAILLNSQLILGNIGLNPSRIGIIRVLKRMGANIKVKGQGLKVAPKSFEPMGDIVVKSSVLKAATIRREEIPSLIDELPVLMVAAACARGKSVFEGVEELRVKETDRIRSMSDNLRKMGVKIWIIKTAKAEKIIIEGTGKIKGAKVKSFADHRTAMSMVVAGFKATGKTLIDDIGCINKSFPGFLNILNGLIK